MLLARVCGTRVQGLGAAVLSKREGGKLMGDSMVEGGVACVDHANPLPQATMAKLTLLPLCIGRW